MDDIDRTIIDSLQGGFPLCASPYAQVAEELGIDESTLLSRLKNLLDARVLTRFGPMFQVERMGGAFVLAALKVAEARYAEVTESVNAFPEVAHNYRREHAFNMWFVLATRTPQDIAATISRIEAATGLQVYAFPKEREYFVEMKLPVLS
jgi:siroheme decarboxylase